MLSRHMYVIIAYPHCQQSALILETAGALEMAILSPHRGAHLGGVTDERIGGRHGRLP